MPNERFWNRLLQAVADDNVIPIIGNRLLADGEQSFHKTVAEKLLEVNGLDTSQVPWRRGREIHDAVYTIKAARPVNDSDLYGDVAEAIQSVSADFSNQLPPALSQFATIAGFRLIVYLGSDNLLARALSGRAQVNEIVHAPNLPLSEKIDLDPAWKNHPGEVNLLYLFGKARSNFFAIHEEDILEYAHNLMSGGQGVPVRFLDEMRSRNLLLIGCCFPDWLSRFFIRLFSKDRLSSKRKHEWYIDDSQGSPDLTVFLSTFSRDTDLVLDTPPSAFIEELHNRWQAQYGGVQSPPVIPGSPPAKGALFFISYSRQTDSPAVQRLYEKLRELGAEEGDIWFDRKTIEPGNDYQMTIITGIDRCRYFLPVISDAADQRPEGFFRREWNRAIKRQEAMADGYNFVLPLIVDEAERAPETYQNVPSEWLNHIHFGRAPGGEPDAPTYDTLLSWLRRARKQKE